MSNCHTHPLHIPRICCFVVSVRWRRLTLSASTPRCPTACHARDACYSARVSLRQPITVRQVSAFYAPSMASLVWMFLVHSDQLLRTFPRAVGNVFPAKRNPVLRNKATAPSTQAFRTPRLAASRPKASAARTTLTRCGCLRILNFNNFLADPSVAQLAHTMLAASSGLRFPNPHTLASQLVTTGRSPLTPTLDT